jgi:putative hydrolase of the HAD superfamily
MINHIIFDIGNTLIDFDLDLVTRRLSSRINAAPEALHSFLFRSDFFRRFEKGEIGPDELVSLVNREFGQDLGVRLFDEDFSPIFTPRREMVDLVQSLLGRYELSVLSNTNVLHSRYLESNFPILAEFDHRFYSHALKALKPEPEIFQLVLSRTMSEPEECLFIDDIESHAEGARRCGMDAILFRGEAGLLAELKLRAIL